MLKRREKQLPAIGIGTLMVCSAIFLLTLSSREPVPGKHSWLTGLSGDWAVKIGQSGYEIGRSVSPYTPNAYEIFRWVPAMGKDGKMTEGLEPVFDGVLSYASDDIWILAQMQEQRWGWINCQTHQVSSVESEQEFQDKAPSEVKRLVKDMSIPSPSNRNVLFILGITLLGGSVYLVYRVWFGGDK